MLHYVNKIHIENKLEGMKYPCGQCGFAATRPCDLKKHIRIKHEGLRYPCDQCEDAATSVHF